MANEAILDLPQVFALNGTEQVPLVKELSGQQTTVRATSGLVARLGLASALPGALAWVIDGGGGVVLSGISGSLEVPFDATLQSVTMEADQQGTVSMDIWKCTYAQYDPPTIPTSGNSIVGSSPPTITNAKKYRDATLAGWSTSLTQGDILTFYVSPGAASITKITLSLNINRVVN